MTRSKVNLAYITNDAERKASYKKRKRGLIKKVSELSTLCGVQACAVIYSQYDLVPEVWPSRQGALDVLARFNRLPELEKTRNMVNQYSFTRHRLKKGQDQFTRLHRENRRKEMEIFMYQCGVGLASLKQFDMQNDASHMTSFLDQITRYILSRMEELKRENQHVQAGPASASAPIHILGGAPMVVSGAPAPSPTPPPPPPPPQSEVPLNVDQWLSMVDDYTRGGVHDMQISFHHGWEYDGEVLPHPYLSNSYDPGTSAAGPSDSNAAGSGGN